MEDQPGVRAVWSAAAGAVAARAGACVRVGLMVALTVVLGGTFAVATAPVAGAATTVTVPGGEVAGVTVPPVLPVSVPGVTLPVSGPVLLPPVTSPPAGPAAGPLSPSLPGPYPPVNASVPSTPAVSPRPSIGPAAPPAAGRVPSGPDAPPGVRRDALRPHPTAALAVRSVRDLGVPIAVAAAVLLFLLVQGRIDERDPKLVDAPVSIDDDTVQFA